MKGWEPFAHRMHVEHRFLLRGMQAITSSILDCGLSTDFAGKHIYTHDRGINVAHKQPECSSPALDK